MNEQFLESHLKALYRLLKHKGYYSRMGALNVQTKDYKEELVSGEESVLDFARRYNGSRNIFIGRAYRHSDGRIAGVSVSSFDIDPLRDNAGREASTDEQHTNAINAGRRILSLYRSGFLASSGNGCLLVYPLASPIKDLQAYYEKESLLIKELQEKVNDLGVKIDATSYEKAVIKAIGTASTKGDIQYRRLSRFLDFPSLPYHSSTGLMDKINSLVAPMVTVPSSTKFVGDPIKRIQAAQECLQRIPKDRCDVYEDWLKVGMALKEFGISGLSLWKEWSKQSEKYEEGTCETKWETFKETPEITLGTLRLWARNVSAGSTTIEGDVPAGDGIADFLQEISPVTWIAEPIIASGSIGFMAGLPETMKSWLMIDLAIECARGGKWLNKFPVSKGTVIFVDQERAKSETQRRFKKLITNKQVKLEDLDLHVFSGTTTRLNLEESYKAFVRKLEKIKPTLLIIDSFITINTGEENNRKDVQTILEKLKEIRTQFGCAIVLIDHETKSVFNDEDQGLLPNAFKIAGSVGKVAAAEFVLVARKTKENSVTVYHVKSTLAPAISSFNVEIKDVGEGIQIQ